MEYKVIGSSYSPVGYVEGIKPHDEILSMPHGSVAGIAAISALCNDAKIIGHDKHAEDEKIYERVGEPTEGKLYRIVPWITDRWKIADHFLSTYFHTMAIVE